MSTNHHFTDQDLPMNNPLLENLELPAFSRLRPEHVEVAIDQLLDNARSTIERTLQNGGPFGWTNLIEPIEDAEDKLNKAWSPVSHMNSVVNSDAMRDAYNACLGKLSAYATETGQNKALQQAYKAIRDSAEFSTLNQAQQKQIDNALRDFHLSGVDLPADKQARYKEISQQLSKLASQLTTYLNKLRFGS